MTSAALRRALSVVLWWNRKAKALAIRLVVWTGKSREALHPKHLLPDSHEKHWYLRHLGTGDVVLDVGCGTGLHALRAAARCRMVYAYDINSSSIESARRSAEVVGMENVGFWQSAVLPTINVDAVMCFDVLEHLQTQNERSALLEGIRRILRGHGRLLLLVPNRETSWKRRLRAVGLDSRSDPDHKIEYTMPELRAELAAAGFTIVVREPCVADTPWIGVIDIVGGLSLTVYGWMTRRRRARAAQHPDEDAGLAVLCVPA